MVDGGTQKPWRLGCGAGIVLGTSPGPPAAVLRIAREDRERARILCFIKENTGGLLNGATPVIGVQIPDSVVLQNEVELAWTAGSGELVEFTQRMEYRDWLFTCDHCGSRGHRHRVCTKEKARKDLLPAKEPNWAQKLQESGKPAQEQKRSNSSRDDGRTMGQRDEDKVTGVSAWQADQKVFGKLFPGTEAEGRISFKVCLVLQRDFKGMPEVWMSQDRHCQHFPGTALENSWLWNKTTAQMENLAKEGLRSILGTICRDIRSHVLEALAAQARFTVVHNSSRKVYFAGWVRATWNELPSSMTGRWMQLPVLWDQARSWEMVLAVSFAEVIGAMFPQRPVVSGEGQGRWSRGSREGGSKDDPKRSGRNPSGMGKEGAAGGISGTTRQVSK